MPLPHCQHALDGLGPDSKRAVEDTFLAWSGEAILGQVSRNVGDETALAAADFLSLLTAFATELANGIPPQMSWISACRNHKLRGRQISNAQSPAILGRARSLEDHAKSVAKASFGSLTPQEAKKHLLKHSGSPNPVSFEPFLRAAALGNYFVWATFNPDNPHGNPFDRLPNTRVGVCTALGLGGPIFNETLVLLVWNHADSGSPPLHRPTVADAEDYPYYRPCAHVGALWGLTEPLQPNPDGLQPQPEVVMPETPSRGSRSELLILRVEKPGRFRLPEVVF
jgi:hypothetical protein